MTLKCLATGSTGNCYVLTSDSGKKLILDAGIPIAEIKKGIDFDVANVEGCLITHNHKDHVLSANKVANFCPVWEPYKSEQKKMHTHIGSFDVTCFDVPHNGTENRAFIITVDGAKILYATDYEYIPYDLSKQGINIALVELNYQSDRVNETREPHYNHVVLGHAEERTVIDFLSTIKNNLRKIFLCHMSQSLALDRPIALDHLREVIPEYISINYIFPGKIYDISECPF